MDEKFYTYIILTERNTYYCGYTDNIEKRYKAHCEGKGAKYTRANKPVKLILCRKFSNKHDAMHEEYTIKKMTRKQKEDYIRKYSK